MTGLARSSPPPGSRGGGREAFRRWRLADTQIRLNRRQGHVHDGQIKVTTQPRGVTAIRGTVIDQAALPGLLAKLRDLGLPRISVRRV